MSTNDKRNTAIDAIARTAINPPLGCELKSQTGMPIEVREYLQTVINKEISNLSMNAEASRQARADYLSDEKRYFLKEMRFKKAVSTMGNTVYFVNLPLGIRASIHKHGSSWMLNSDRSVKFRSRTKAWQHLKTEWNGAITDLFGHDGRWSDLWYKLEIRMMYPMIEGLLQTWCGEMDRI